MKQRTVWTFFPALLATLGVATAHLLAAFVEPSASPILLVGDRIITYTPTPLKTFAVETFGNWDKPILIGSIALVVLVASILLGRYLHRQRIILGTALLAIATLPLLLALTQPSFSWIGLVPSTYLLIFVSVSLYLAFARLHDHARVGDEGESKETFTLTRRAALIGGGGMALMAGVSGAVGQFVIKSKLALEAITLPKPVKMLKPKISHFDDVEGISPLITPVEDFYRVDVNLAVPVVDHEDWTLTIAREGYDDVTYTYADLLDQELVERDITLVCVSNTVGGKYAGSGRWLGVDLVKLLEPFEPDKGEVDQLFATSVDGYTSSTPLKYVMDGREGMLALGYNGEVLTRVHGFPARLLVPGMYGFVGATKWLERIELTTYAKKQAYWTKKDWATDAPIRPMTRIDTPKAFSDAPSETVIAGVAWAGVLGVKTVEVSIDGGEYKPADIDVPEGPTDDWDYWVQWKLPVTLGSGSHNVAARCVTKTDVTQEDVRREPFPSGASGVHNISFTVEK